MVFTESFPRCVRRTRAEFKERLDNLTDTLNYMSQWNRVCELLQECKEKWNKYSSELYTYEDYLKIRKFREQYDSEGGKEGNGFFVSRVSSGGKRKESQIK